MIVFLGPPGAGKGTQGKLLSQDLGIPHISTGDLFRDAVKAGDPDAIRIMQINPYTSKEVLRRILKNRIDLPDCRNGFILDGCPRTLRDLKVLEEVLAESNQSFLIVFNLQAGIEEISERLLDRVVCPSCKSSFNLKSMIPAVEGICDHCQQPLNRRREDTPKIIESRYAWYLNKTLDVLDHFEKLGLTHNIGAVAPVETVNAQLQAAVKEALRPR